MVQVDETAEIEISPSVDDILPNYQSQMNTINNMETDEINREKDRVVLNKRLISKIDQELNRLNNLKSEKPELSDKIDKRINALNTMKSVKESDITSSENRITELNVSAGNPEVNLNEIVTVEEIDPSYNAVISDINNSSEQEIDKEKNKLNATNDFISKINQEIQKLNNFKADNPELAGKVDKRIEGLENLKKAKTAENDLSQQRINELSSTTIGPEEPNLNEIVNVEEIDPNYNTSISDINSSSNEEIDKERNKIKANNRLIYKIDGEISK